MHAVRGIFVALGLSLVSFTLSSPARAQSAEAIAAAKKDFADGIALEEQGKFAQALVKFRSVAKVKETPQILFHVGLCESKTGALVEATQTLRRAVDTAHAEGNDKVESAAQGELDAATARLPRLVLAVVGQPTSVEVDGQTVVIDRPVPLNPGSHQIVAHYADGDVTTNVTVAEGATAKVELAPPAAGGTAEPTGPVVSAPSQQNQNPVAAPHPAQVDRGTPKTHDDTLAWVLVGGGAALVVGGFVTWKLRGDQIDTLDSICPASDQCPRARESEVEDAKSKGSLYSTLSVGLWGVGAAVLGTGGYLLLGSSSDSARVAPAVAPGVAGAQLSGRF